MDSGKPWIASNASRTHRSGDPPFTVNATLSRQRRQADRILQEFPQLALGERFPPIGSRFFRPAAFAEDEVLMPIDLMIDKTASRRSSTWTCQITPSESLTESPTRVPAY